MVWMMSHKNKLQFNMESVKHAMVISYGNHPSITFLILITVTVDDLIAGALVMIRITLLDSICDSHK